MPGSIRLQKFLAEAGVASRRAGEQMILAGRVSVNGAIVRILGTKVDPLHDAVLFDGKPVHVRRKLYIALNKPPGCVCSRSDERGRPTIFGLLPREWDILHNVGRLDYDTEGLIFLTNDGEFSLHLTHPRYGVRKKYLVTVDGKVDGEMLKTILTGVWHDGEKLKAERAHVISSTSSQSVVELELAEGKNREIRRMFEAQSRTVTKLQRTQIGKIKLGELKLGKWRTLTDTEIKSLLS